MHPFDLPTQEFDLHSLEHWLLVLGLVGMSIYGFWVVGKKENRPTCPTHRYNRKAGTVELIDDDPFWEFKIQNSRRKIQLILNKEIGLF